ncbi:hypothetical protein [Streptomyces sp. NBC_00354]|uniref:hypothetical protein n=1 Tax=Streptomyces sp. NBC_00354 TaxID=2975723 RepID=UPI002E2667F2
MSTAQDADHRADRHRHADVQWIVAAGWTTSAIARRLDVYRKTVRHFRDPDLDQLLASARERRPAGVLEPLKPYLNTRFTKSQGQISGSRLPTPRNRGAGLPASSARTSTPSALEPGVSICPSEISTPNCGIRAGAHHEEG